MKIFRSLVVLIHCAAKKEDFADGLHLTKKMTRPHTHSADQFVNLVSLSGIAIYIICHASIIQYMY